MARVELLTSEMVVPAEETPAGSVWLSNLDLAARRGYTPTVYFYRSNDGKPAGCSLFVAEAVKESLARALVAFYPLAGRLGLDDTGRMQIDCTGEGAVLVTARSDYYALDDLLNEFAPCSEMRDLFVPATPAPDPPCAPLLFAQVTYLRCGGVVLGTATHHSFVDARSAVLFVGTWASIARGSSSTLPPPCFHHRLLLAARPTRTVLYDHPEYKAEAAQVVSAYASAVITLTKEQVTALKDRWCEGASTFRAVAAMVWQCACRARSLPPDAETRFHTVIDMRARLAPPLPPGYFGNAVVSTSARATAGEVLDGPVAHVARRVLAAATSHGDDYARSLVDYLEGVDAMNLPWSGCSPRVDLRGVSWMGMSLHDADFGWGAPVFVGPAQMTSSGFFTVMQAPEKDGAVMLLLALEPETMLEFRKLFADQMAHLELMETDEVATTHQ